MNWAKEHLEKEIPIKDVFQQNEILDVIGITKGKGFKGQLDTCANTTFLLTALSVITRCDQPMAYKEASSENPQGAA